MHPSEPKRLQKMGVLFADKSMHAACLGDSIKTGRCPNAFSTLERAAMHFLSELTPARIIK